jgi:octaprenyl-diphosphate synthase
MAHADAPALAAMRHAVEHGDSGALPDVLAAIHASDSLAYSRRRAAEYASVAERALDGLGDNPYTHALRGLARYAVDRES